MDKKISATFFVLLGIFLLGTIFYHYTEGWTWVDSFYFTGITVLTIGYGDLHPTTPLTKIVTVFFSFSTIGIVLYAASIVAKERKIFAHEVKDLVVKEFKKTK